MIDKEVKALNIDAIIDLVKAHKDEAWLKSLAQEQREDKNGKMRKISFVEIRSAVINRYDELKELRPKVQKKDTFYEKIAKL